MIISLLASGGDFVEKLYILAFWIISVVLSLSVHEWAHAYSAHLMGDDTARLMGRMTLNPLAHLDPTGFFLLLIAGFGWAKPVPVSPRNYKNFRKGEFIVSFAGIFMNLILALISALAIIIIALVAFRSEFGVLSSLAAQYPVNDSIYSMFYYLPTSAIYYRLFMFFTMLGAINCSLAIFNLLPIYPLDGSHIFELLFSKLLGPRPILWLRQYGRFLLIGLLVLSTVLANTTGVSPIGYLCETLFGLFQRLFFALGSLFM